MGGRLFSLRFVGAMLLTAGLLVLGGINIDQKRKWVAPNDGCSWIQGPEGVEARQVVADGPAGRAGIQPGDILWAINGHPVESNGHVTKILYDLGTWSRAIYTIQRDGTLFESTVVVGELPQSAIRQRLYLEIIGIYYFL